MPSLSQAKKEQEMKATRKGGQKDGNQEGAEEEDSASRLPSPTKDFVLLPSPAHMKSNPTLRKAALSPVKSTTGVPLCPIVPSRMKVQGPSTHSHKGHLNIHKTLLLEARNKDLKIDTKCKTDRDEEWTQIHEASVYNAGLAEDVHIDWDASIVKKCEEVAPEVVDMFDARIIICHGHFKWYKAARKQADRVQDSLRYHAASLINEAAAKLIQKALGTVVRELGTKYKGPSPPDHPTESTSRMLARKYYLSVYQAACLKAQIAYQKVQAVENTTAGVEQGAEVTQAGEEELAAGAAEDDAVEDDAAAVIPAPQVPGADEQDITLSAHESDKDFVALSDDDDESDEDFVALPNNETEVSQQNGGDQEDDEILEDIGFALRLADRGFSNDVIAVGPTRANKQFEKLDFSGSVSSFFLAPSLHCTLLKMPPKRSPSPADASPRKRTKRSPSPNPSPSSPPSPCPMTTNASASGQHVPVVVSPLRPVSWRTASSAEIDEALKSVFQLGGHSFDVDVTDLQWHRIAKRLRCCARCEGKAEPCSAANGAELVCDACQRAHKGCSLGIAYRRFDAPLSWARQQFDSRMAGLSSRSYNLYCQPPSFFTSLEEAIQHAARSAIPPPSSVGRVGPPGRGRIIKTSTSRSSPSRSHPSVSPLGYLYEPRAPGSHSSPCKQGDSARTVASGSSNVPSPATPVPSLRPSCEVRVIRGPTIRIPPPTQCLAPPPHSTTSPLPLRIGDVPIPPGLELARELEAFEATEAEVAADSRARFFKEREAARLAAAETKRHLESEQQRRDKRAVKVHWEGDMREKERNEKEARRQRRALRAQQLQQRNIGSSTSQSMASRVASSRLEPRTLSPRSVPPPPVAPPGSVSTPLSPPPPQAPSPPRDTSPIPVPPLISSPVPSEHPTFSPLTVPSKNPPDHWSPVSPRSWTPPRVTERSGLDGAAYHRAHLDIASGRDPVMTDLQNAYGDSHQLGPSHPDSLGTIGELSLSSVPQELLDMQRRLNSAQLDLETERARNRMSVVQTCHLESQLADLRRLNSEQERMLKNCQVEYELLEGEVKVLADSAAASAASAAQAKAYKALVVPGYPDPAARIEDLEGVLARYEVELRKSEEGRGVAVDRAIRCEVEIGNTSQLIHDLLGTCEHLRQRARSAEDSASSLRESNLDLVAQLGGSYSLEGASENNALLRVESARPASFLAEVARRVEFLVQEVRSSLLHGRTDPQAYEHAEEASERLRLHLRECLSRMEQSLTFLLRVAGRYREGVAPLVDQYSTVDPAALLSLAEYAGLVAPSHHNTQRPLYPLLSFDTSQPLGCAPPSDSLRHIFFLPLLSRMRADARDLLRAQLQTCIEDDDYWESRAALLLHLEGELADLRPPPTPASPDAPVYSRDDGEDMYTDGEDDAGDVDEGSEWGGIPGAEYDGDVEMVDDVSAGGDADEHGVGGATQSPLPVPSGSTTTPPPPDAGTNILSPPYSC
ncbi:hypothetical protein BT96DRAFT_1006480 [Gymnopus androsaceus JB14]|uniref:Uncharacterized protein n=1 Tax=Gymnopus androsaceus JB14 TaxID=1447944 RepID=A0A6A4GKS6_9AGAR|nr:hypothetical protein BT96DRAFT_1006480 [Gymnopus androsaceus JB14]